MKLRRVLSFPLISTKTNVWRESDFKTHWQIAKELSHVHFVMMLNESSEIPEEYQQPNISYIQTLRWYPFAMMQARVPDQIVDAINPLNGMNQCDAILLSHSVAGGLLRRQLEFSPTCYVPVFVNEGKAADFGKTHDSVTDLDLFFRASTYANCRTFFGTDYEKEIALGASRRYLSGAELLRMDKNSRGRSPGVPLREVHSIGASIEKFPEFTLMFAARFNSNKRWIEVLKQFETYCTIAPDARAIAITPSIPAGNVTDVTYFQKTQIKEALPRRDYTETICRAHVHLSMSEEEGFSFGWSEQIATGNPVLFPDKKWARSLMPHPEYRKLFYRKDAEILPLLKYVRANYAQIRAEIAPAVARFVEEHDLPNACADIEREMVASLEPSFERLKDWPAKMAKVLERMPDTFAFSHYIKECQKDNMYFGQPYRQLCAMSSCRNAYFWLQETCECLRTPELTFRKLPA